MMDVSGRTSPGRSREEQGQRGGRQQMSVDLWLACERNMPAPGAELWPGNLGPVAGTWGFENEVSTPQRPMASTDSRSRTTGLRPRD